MKRLKRWGIGLLILVGVMAVLLWRSHAWLAITERSGGTKVLVVEGWMDEHQLEQADALYGEGGYDLVYTTGTVRPFAYYLVPGAHLRLGPTKDPFRSVEVSVASLPACTALVVMNGDTALRAPTGDRITNHGIDLRQRASSLLMKIPPRLSRLEELANNLWYSWDRSTRTLFSRIDPRLWEAIGHNPKSFLKRVDESLLLKAASDQTFLASYNSVLSAYDSYHSEPTRYNRFEGFESRDQIAYFCFEFGFHESLPVYSGGLGILAGDHCKAASDLCLPCVAIGLLYRQGYFSQTIDSQGNQRAIYNDSDFGDLPVEPALHDDGTEVHIHIDLPGRSVNVKVWRVIIGHVSLFLLDTDFFIRFRFCCSALQSVARQLQMLS